MLRQMKTGMIFLSIGYLAVGLLLLINPEQSLEWICYAFGAVILISGAINLIRYLVLKGRGPGAPFLLVSGVIAAAVGVFLLLQPLYVITILPIVFGLFILLDGILRIENGFELAHAHGHKWWAVVLLGLVSIGLALLIILHPLSAVINLMTLCGLLLVVEGALNLGCIIYSTMELHAVARAVEAVAQAQAEASRAASVSAGTASAAAAAERHSRFGRHKEEIAAEAEAFEAAEQPDSETTEPFEPKDSAASAETELADSADLKQPAAPADAEPQSSADELPDQVAPELNLGSDENS